MKHRNLKTKTIFIVLALLICCLSFSFVSADTSLSAWAVEEVAQAQAYGLVPKSVMGNYKKEITREEFCELAVKLYESLSQKTATLPSVNTFTDTNNPEILKAYALGIVYGVNTKQPLFAPNDNVTREQISVMFHRTLSIVNPNIANENYSLTFADKDKVSSWAKDAVAFMSKYQIVSGVGNNEMNPLGTATREQGIALVKRTYEKFKTETPSSPIQSKTTNITVKNPPTGYLIYQELNPDLGNTKVVADGISVFLPADINLIGNEVLSVAPATDLKAVAGLNFVKGYEINLGTRTQFSAPIEISITMPKNKAYGAFYYNPMMRLWEEAPYYQVGNIVTIKTNHLSRYAVAELEKDNYNDPMAKNYYYSPEFEQLSLSNVKEIAGFTTAEMNTYALDKGWEAANRWFEIGSIATGTAKFTAPGLAKLNDVMGSMGKVLAPIQVFYDLKAGQHTSAAVTAYQAALDALISKLGSTGANVGMLGGAMLNFSIQEFAQEAISSKEQQYEKAFNYYYDKNNSLDRNIAIRDLKGWYDEFYNIVATSPKNLNERINASINKYVRAIWTDPALITAQGIVGQQGQADTIIGGGAMLNKDLQERISNNYVRHLSGYLTNILNRVVDDYEWNERANFKEFYAKKVVLELNKTYKLKVNAKTPPNVDAKGLKVGVTNLPLWQGQLNEYNEWSFEFTLLAYLRAGMPQEVFYTDYNGMTHKAHFDLENLDILFEDNSGVKEFALWADKERIEEGQKVEFSLVVQPKDLPYTVLWAFPDGREERTPLTTSKMNHVFAKAGSYIVRVTLQDAALNSIKTDSVYVHVIKKAAPKEEEPEQKEVEQDILDCNCGGGNIDYSELIRHEGLNKLNYDYDGFWFDEAMVNEVYYRKGSKLHGCYIMYFQENPDKIAYIGCYNLGEKEGAHITWFANGNLYKEDIFSTNTKPVKRSLYYQSGGLKEVRTYTDGNITLLETWYENGQKESEVNLTPYGTSTGQNGVEHGVKTLWFANGQIKQQITSTYGFQYLSKTYNQEGYLIKEAHNNPQKPGERHDILYTETGVIKSVTYYRPSLPKVRELIYDSQGVLLYEYLYTYLPDGRLDTKTTINHQG